VLDIALAEIFSKAAAFPRRCLPLATHDVPTLECHAPEPMKHSNPKSGDFAAVYGSSVISLVASPAFTE
jgi:hypothetical protein